MGGEVGVLSPSAPGALANLWRTWIREETQLRHGVCLTVTVMSVARLWQTGPKAGELRKKEEDQTGWSPLQVCAQPYMHRNTCGNHVHTHGHRHTGSLQALPMSPVTSSIVRARLYSSSPIPLSRSPRGCAGIIQASYSLSPVSI